jgi:hypothetical protein
MILDRLGPGPTSAIQGLLLDWIKVLVEFVAFVRAGAVSEAGKFVKPPDASHQAAAAQTDLHPPVWAIARRDATQPR